MKKSLVFSMVLFLLSVNYANAQVSKSVKNVKNNIQKEIVGDQNKNSGNKTLPEPASACTQPELVLDLGGKLKVDYSEISITVGDDGRMLVQDRVSSNYYIIKDGVTQGPYANGDPALAAFGVIDDDKKSEGFLLRYKDYISKSDDKFLITFMGKKYGPYAQIDQFVVTKSKEKFAAMVTENILVSEDKAKKLDEAMKNAKTDQEKMNLSMQFAQEMQSQMMNKGSNSILPKFITNIPGAIYDPMKSVGAQFNGNLKYDDILLFYYDKITDMKGNTILSIGQDKYTSDNLYISADNSNYAIFNYGTITLKDKSTLPEVFNPHWLKADGKIYLAYMYYSPKRNSIMQCKIPF